MSEYDNIFIKGGICLQAEYICKRIADTIEDNDKTIKSLAEYMEVSERQITRWKNNQSEMGIYKLYAFCKFYNVSADKILGIER